MNTQPEQRLHILVVGGAGYIGSHMVRYLLAQGCRVTVFDNLSTGHRDAIAGADFVEGDLADTGCLDRLFAENHFDAVMHFAGSIQVGESVLNPGLYYRNNVSNSLNLFDAMVGHGVRQLVFSSTAAIFGEPRYTPIDELHDKNPLNPYGRSKLMVEQILADYDHAHGIKNACLRYFNAAGAAPDGSLGERHEPETHLIPIALEAAQGRRTHLAVYGNDYDTPDGTCVRDYIHVHDLCSAHWLALMSLRKNGASMALNLGNGNGFSVKEVIDTVAEVTGKVPVVKMVSRRDGDPARLIADSRLAKVNLGWSPVFPGLKDIISHAWRFAKNHWDSDKLE